jgi:hypothetical protein
MDGRSPWVLLQQVGLSFPALDQPVADYRDQMQAGLQPCLVEGQCEVQASVRTQDIVGLSMRPQAVTLRSIKVQRKHHGKLLQLKLR